MMDDAVAHALAAEMAALEGPMEVVMRPDSVFALVAMLQLALRHPGCTGVPRAVAERFLAGAREYFAGCPTVLEVIAAGDRGA